MTGNVTDRQKPPPHADDVRVFHCRCGCNAVVLALHRETGEPLAFTKLDPDEAKSIGQSLLTFAAEAERHAKTGQHQSQSAALH